jgi:hypothetical protein
MKLLLGLLVAGKPGKVLLPSGSMLLSVFTYAFVFDWKCAVSWMLFLNQAL